MQERAHHFHIKVCFSFYKNGDFNFSPDKNIVGRLNDDAKVNICLEKNIVHNHMEK